MWLAPFLEEVRGKHAKNIGQLLQRGWVGTATLLDLPDARVRNAGEIRQAPLTEAAVDPQLLQLVHIDLHCRGFYANIIQQKLTLGNASGKI